ncbi:hypothetical protein B0A55_00805 [Friedmanniomyces simplex]|uniref:rRNA methyltransferase 2, mitochondrial n=1 Tax=Friedmanniomyces simplex TaxID=329884 RepID=A0A4U0Y467_9PEZI|nr:hypothetical protein B0A55_00805 [Friedmanniomyces simplex]
MSTPHRGLPPPSAMNLPDPSRPPPPSLGQPLGMMPQSPYPWQGQEDSMRNWLAAKAEEDKRKQEEEKTRQEGYRLEQRRIEQSMLRESLQAGVPPSMVPMIYAGIGGSNLANGSMELLQQYAAQLQAAQQQIQQQASPDTRRETRMISQAPAPYSAAQPAQQQGMQTQAAEPMQANAPLQTTFSAYQPAIQRAAPTSAPRSATHTQLPRLTTNEMYVHQPPPANPGSAHPLQQTQTISQDQPASSPSIYFHHWVPPGESKGQPQTPAGKDAPLSAHPSSHVPDGDYKDSPRKRKAQGGHQPNPPPSAGPQYTSPSFSSATRKSGHARSRSITSAKESDSRPESRREPESQRPAQLEAGEDPRMRERRDERPSTDSYAREAKVAGLKSRAAFKLLEINAKFRLFHPGDTVVDLGYAPGSWSQVAVNRTAPGGRVVGIDVIPAQPPRGVSTLQGDFLSPAIREEMRKFVADPDRGRPRGAGGLSHSRGDGEDEGGITEEQLDEESKGVVELGKAATGGITTTTTRSSTAKAAAASAQKAQDVAAGRMVNVVLSDMCEPWPLATSTWVKSVSNPWRRMMNTSGMAFRDHAGSMDLCLATLEFAYDSLATGGNFLCKFYQGGEDHAFEARLKKLFEKVYRIKPDSSRKESKEAYLVGLRRRPGIAREVVLGEG